MSKLPGKTVYVSQISNESDCGIYLSWGGGGVSLSHLVERVTTKQPLDLRYIYHWGALGLRPSATMQLLIQH